METLDAAGVGVNPGDRVLGRLDTGANVELEHHVFRRSRGDGVHGTFAVGGDEFRFVIVIPGVQVGGAEFFVGGGQRIGDLLPPVGALDAAGARHDDVFRAQHFVEVHRFDDAVSGK